MTPLNKRPKKSAETKALDAARHASIRARAHEALAFVEAQGEGAVDVEALAQKLGADLTFEDLEGAKARVVQLGNHARIIISTRIVGVGAIRFCISHEIAHLMLKHYLRDGDLGRAFKRQKTCSPLASDGSEIERDASVFATELLMPTPLVTPMCRIVLTSMEPVRAISSAFQTSMYASARRYVELTPERCAVVIAQHGRVQWVQKSATFSAWIPERRTVDPATAAYDYFDGRKLDEAPRVLPASTWCARASADATLYEHATAIPETGTVFSLLWMPGTS
jgi:Zn-dependent peptidase ImmA (M78 family)